MVGNVAFRSAVVGGFNREDVMNYVEQSVNENRAALAKAKAETEEMFQQVTDLRAENDALREQLEQQHTSMESQLEEIRSMADDYAQIKDENARIPELEQTVEDLQQQLSQAKAQSSQERGLLQRQIELKLGEMTKEKERLEQALARANASVEEQAAKLADQNQQLEQMSTRMKQMKRDAEAYQVLCGRVGQIEMDMRFRTLRMEQEIREKMESQADEARATYNGIVSSANSDAQEVRRQAQEELDQMKSTVATTSAGVNEAISNALNEMGLVKDMLEHLNGCLSDHVDAVNSIEMNPVEEKVFPEVVLGQSEEAPEAAPVEAQNGAEDEPTAAEEPAEV